MAKILLVGDDLSLLSVRAAVLARTGASTVCCNRREFDRELKNDRFDLVVEVLSPSTARRDLNVKYHEYAANGVKEYWVVDPANGSVSVYALAGDHFEEVTVAHRLD